MQSSQDGPLYILWGHRLLFPNHILFLSLKIDFAQANIAVPDEMQHYAVFHLGSSLFTKVPI